MSHDHLIDSIYEAAFNPEQWNFVLEGLNTVSGSAAGEFFVFDDIRAVQCRATDMTREIAAFISDNLKKTDHRVRHFYAQPSNGFVLADEYFPEAARKSEAAKRMQAIGLDSQIGAIIPMPGGELVVFSLERWQHLGRHEREAIERLNALHPHLARASFIATRLGLEQAQAAVATLEALGLPAAVLSASGKVRVSNALLDTIADRLRPAAFGGITITDPLVDALFQQAVTEVRDADDNLVRSIPVPARNEEQPLIVHVLPLRRSALDIFSSANVLIAATSIQASTFVPAPNILMGLFDLTPSEVKLAAALAKGHSLQDAAAGNGIQFSTARSYLEKIFRKTGTHQQSQLVALLKSTQPLNTPPQSPFPGADHVA